MYLGNLNKSEIVAAMRPAKMRVDFGLEAQKTPRIIDSKGRAFCPMSFPTQAAMRLITAETDAKDYHAPVTRAQLRAFHVIRSQRGLDHAATARARAIAAANPKGGRR